MKKQHDHRSIQSKLLISMGLVVFVGVLFTGWAVIAMNRLGALTDELVAADKELNITLQIRNSLLQMEMLELSYVLSHDPEFKHEHEKYFTHTELYLRNALIRTEDSTLQAILFEIERGLSDYTNIFLNVIASGDNNDWVSAVSFGEESSNHLEEVTIKVDKVVERYQEIVNDRVETLNQNIVISQIAGSVAIIVYLLLAIWTVRILVNQVSNPIILLIQAAERIQEGNFNPGTLGSLTGRGDEIGRLARAFVETSADFNQREKTLQEELKLAR